MLRVVGLIIGLIVAAVGGVIVYRALFLEPSAAIVVTNTEVRQLPNTMRIMGGIIMLFSGMALAFFSARRKPM